MADKDIKEDPYTVKKLVALRMRLDLVRVSKGFTRTSIKVEMINLKIEIERLENG